MRLFLDTSSLFKLYHKENDTAIIENVFSSSAIYSIHLSEITKIEFYSASWKKVRTNEIMEADAKSIIANFENDLWLYRFIQIDNAIAQQAKNLIDKYGKQGLRTLDSLQLATAIALKKECDQFITTDNLLNSFFIQESLPILP